MTSKREYATSDGLRREIHFNEEDLEFVVEGYELGEPDEYEECIEEDYASEYFYDRFKNFRDAVEKYLDLIEMGWQTVRFSIRPRGHANLSKNSVDFMFHAYKEPIKEYSWAMVVLAVDRICESCAKKLKKIQEIINKVDEGG